jgi:hypothetical protein
MEVNRDNCATVQANKVACVLFCAGCITPLWEVGAQAVLAACAQACLPPSPNTAVGVPVAVDAQGTAASAETRIDETFPGHDEDGEATCSTFISKTCCISLAQIYFFHFFPFHQP